MTKSIKILIALLATSCASMKVGPFADEPREQPTAPEPDWGGHGKSLDAGLSDAQTPVVTRGK